ncbi:MAG: molecular chaperone DjiA [Rhodobacteraceae bacterium]|nr:molecular chaperone DjiA [Paracoccaceae bacterium]
MKSHWRKVKEFLSKKVNVVELTRSLVGSNHTVRRRRVSFTIAVISLGAKLAKIDGRVTRLEIRAFREIFQIPPEEKKNAARVFDYASKNPVGYEYYALEIRKLLGHGSPLLKDILEGLIYIANADGEISFPERRFLIRVNAIFGLPRRQFRQSLNYYAVGNSIDPYTVLGVSRDMPLSEIKKVWRELVMQFHPDALKARGIPREAVRVSELQLSRFNQAWRVIQEDKKFDAIT